MGEKVEIKKPNYEEGINEKDVERELGYSLPKLSDDEIKNISEDINKKFREKFQLANKSIPQNIVKDIIKEIKEKYGFPFSPKPNRCQESPDIYRALPPEYYDIIIENIVNTLILKFQPPPSEEEISDRFARLAANDSHVLKRYGHYLNEHLPLLPTIQQQFKQPVKLILCEKNNCLKKQTVLDLN